MKRRIYLVGAAISATSLVIAMGLAPEASSKPQSKAAPVRCHLSVSVAVPDGSTQVVVPADNGNMYGSVRCRKLFGAGVQSAKFSVADTGDTVGSYVNYFGTGTIRGTFDLTPQEGIFGNPASVSYIGTLTIKRGTGTYAGMRGKATAVCASSDGVHLTCIEKLKLK